MNRDIVLHYYNPDRTVKYWEFSVELRDGWRLYARVRRAPDDEWQFVVAQENADRFIMVSEKEMAELKEEAKEHLDDSEDLIQELNRIDSTYMTDELFAGLVEDIVPIKNEVIMRWTAINFIVRMGNTT